MKVVGLITEYNPLHNGHVYHINEVKKQSGADLIINVMSGTFTMRGDLSLYNKFDKTEQALKAGSDLIIELPLLYSMERADIFAENAVKLLALAGVDEIWIGSETNDPSVYEKFYQEEKETDNSSDFFTSYKTKTGVTLKSNDILGYSYYKAIKKNNLFIRLKTIKRESSDYLDETPTNENITSALAIRKNLNLLDKYTPDYVHKNKNIFDEEKIFSYLEYKIMSMTAHELKEYFFVDEGLENKLHDIKEFENLNDFIQHLVSKRYTKTRIKRMLMYILLGIRKTTVNNVYKKEPDFIRVLGYSENGKAYLSSIKKNVSVYTNLKEGFNEILDAELKASMIIDSIYETEIFKREQKGPVSAE